MFGNFSRNSFDPQKNYTRVLMQQGCPITDSDWNEQMDLVLSQLRALGTSIYDWYGSGDVGFHLDTTTGGQLKVIQGHLVVDGLIAFNPIWNAAIQLPSPIPTDKGIYIELWEHVSVGNPIPLAHLALRGFRPALRTSLRWAVYVASSQFEETTVGNRADFSKALDKTPAPAGGSEPVYATPESLQVT